MVAEIRATGGQAVASYASVEDGSDGVLITKLVSKSAAKASGINAGDHIVSLDRMKVANVAELKTVMFDKQPGDLMHVTVHRKHLLTGDRELQFEVTLR